MPVDSKHPAYETMIPRWTRARDFYEGEDVVKAKGVEYLPMLSGHDDRPNLYAGYKDRATFFNATGRTTDALEGLVFQTEPAVEVPKDVEEQLNDVTLGGVPFVSFAADVISDVILMGRYGVLVDMPPEVEGPVSPDAPPVDALHPYLAAYTAENIINWKVERRSGEMITTMIVLCEHDEVVGKDRYDIGTVERYRVLELDGEGLYVSSLWEEVSDSATGRKTWVEIAHATPTRRGERLSFIPFTFINPGSITPNVEKSPLEDLIVVNLSHYRTMADLERARHLVALPTPYVVGGLNDEDDVLELGSAIAWILPLGSSVGMLECSGDLSILVTADESKRKMMAILGARMLEGDTAQETLGAVAMRHSGEHATLRSSANTVSLGLTQVLKQFAWWQGTEEVWTDVEATVKLNTEFFTQRLAPAEVASLVASWQQGGFTYETLYFNLERGGFTRPGVEVEEEKTAMADEKEVDAELNARLFPELAAANAAKPKPGDPQPGEDLPVNLR